MELLVTLSIGGILLSCVYLTFHTALSAQVRSKDVLASLQWTRYAFRHFAKDARNIRSPAAGKIQCEGGSCIIPIRDENDQKAWAYYRSDEKGDLVREILAEKAGKTERSSPLVSVTIGEGLAAVNFKQVVSGGRSKGSGMLIMKLAFGENGKPGTVYEKKVYLELNLDEKRSI